MRAESAFRPFSDLMTVVQLQNIGAVSVVSVDNPPVNALSASVREGLINALKQAENDPSTTAILLLCEGKTFIAGADISEFGKRVPGPTLREVEDVMDGLNKPLVAAIHGTALGGGLELAMCAHYRLAVASAKLGLPEVNLGIVPGAGGTQRLPRLVGVEKALSMIVGGKPIGAPEALHHALLDAIAPEGELREFGLAFTRGLSASSFRRTRALDTKLLAVKDHPEIFKKARAELKAGPIAPARAVDCVEAAVKFPFDEGLAIERRIFEELRSSPQSAALRYAFFAERKASQIPDIENDAISLPIRRVGVVGAGTMGGGIAMCFANAGLPVTIVEREQAALERGLAIIRKNYQSAVRRGRLEPDNLERRMASIKPSLEISSMAECDLVIEAAFERMDVKQEIFRELASIVRSDTILATNTSYLDVNQIAAVTPHPERVVGLHFFSPANVMRLLEIVRPDAASPAVIATAIKLAKSIGKVGVLVGVAPGFVGNRMLRKRQDAAQALVLEGTAPWDIDAVLTKFGMPMGPFAMSDLAGLDLFWRKETSTSETLVERLNELGRHGQKSGAGYYDYAENRKASPSPVTERLIGELMAKKKITPRRISEQEILERLLFPMINEGALILADKKVTRASDIDVVWINGYGWPAWLGGPMYYADRLGLASVASGIRKYGGTPAPLIESLAKEGRSFADLST